MEVCMGVWVCMSVRHTHKHPQTPHTEYTPNAIASVEVVDDKRALRLPMAMHDEDNFVLGMIVGVFLGLFVGVWV